MTDSDDGGENSCPACGQEYESVSVHQDGLMVNLYKNPRFHRVCFNPISQGGHAHVEFYHHTYEQVPDAGAVTEDTPV